MKHRLKTVPALALSALGLIATIGGAAWTLGRPPYANETWTKEQIAQVQGQYASMRLNQVDSQIVQLENERQRRRLSPIETQLLERLYRERAQLLCQLRIVRC